VPQYSTITSLRHPICHRPIPPKTIFRHFSLKILFQVIHLGFSKGIRATVQNYNYSKTRCCPRPISPKTLFRHFLLKLYFQVIHLGFSQAIRATVQNYNYSKTRFCHRPISPETLFRHFLSKLYFQVIHPGFRKQFMPEYSIITSLRHPLCHQISQKGIFQKLGGN
jgi:hypothetical protein